MCFAIFLLLVKDLHLQEKVKTRYQMTPKLNPKHLSPHLLSKCLKRITLKILTLNLQKVLYFQDGALRQSGKLKIALRP